MGVDKINKTGRGATLNPTNPFATQSIFQAHPEGIDDYEPGKSTTEVFYDSPKNILSKNDSPDIPYTWSINPYQGCEHGCAYCYARNTHNYWGYSAGLDFESKIIAKITAADLLKKKFNSGTWKAQTIVMSGNTDCYQPIEKKLGITRKLLEVFWNYRHPVGIITKRDLVKRDLDLLQPMAASGLVKVLFSLTTLDDKLKRKLEPRSSHPQKILETMHMLSNHGIPTGVMAGPIIPSINDHELESILKSASEAGALQAGFSILRLNGKIAEVFSQWLDTYYPERKDKVINKVKSVHGGKVNDSKFGRRMRGQGEYAELYARLFKTFTKKYFAGRQMPDFNYTLFRNKGEIPLFKS